MLYCGVYVTTSVYTLVLCPWKQLQSIVMSMSVCLSARYLHKYTRDLYQIFLHVAYGRGSVFLRQGDEIPREGAVLGIFFPIDNALHSTAFGTHTKKAEPIEMPFGMMSSFGLRNSVLRVTSRRNGQFWGKRAWQA